MIKAIVGMAFVVALIVALVVAVLHSTVLGSYICGGAFAVAIVAVLMGKM